MDFQALDVPALLAVAVAAYAAVQSKRTHQEVKSPNGTKTGAAVHDLHTKVDRVLWRQNQHEEADERRFKALEEKVGN